MLYSSCSTVRFVYLQIATNSYTSTSNWSVRRKKSLYYMSQKCNCFEDEKKRKKVFERLQFLILYVRNCIFTRRNIWCFQILFRCHFDSTKKLFAIQCTYNCFIFIIFLLESIKKSSETNWVDNDIAKLLLIFLFTRT